MKTNVDKPLHELEGFLELGMARESLALARKLLDSTPIDAARFFVCVDVLLIQGSQLPKWRSRVNAAHERLTAADQRAVREKLFHFYVTLEDWASAHAFLPPRPTSAATLLFSMWTLLELRKTD